MYDISNSIENRPSPKHNLKILVAEDNELNYLLIKTILTKSDYTPIRAKNGREAIDIMQSDADIALILMDIQMPEVDGITAARIIRQFNQKIPIVMQTSYQSMMTEATEAGCNEYLTKPLRREVLLGVIGKFTGAA